MPRQAPDDVTAERPRVALVGPDPEAHGGIAGFEHALISSSLAARFELVPVPTYRDGGLAAKLGHAVRGLALLRRLCAHGEIDIVHVNSSWRISLLRKSAAVSIARAHGCPVVLQLHGSGFERGLHRRGLRGALARAWTGRIARAADIVVAATPNWATDVGELLGLDDVRVVPNTAEAAPGGVPVGGGSAETILFLGRLTRAKGVFELVEAAAALRPSHPRLRLVFGGTGRDEEPLRALVAARGLAGVVELPGWVSGAEKQQLLTSASCLALPSHAEGLPLAVLEALLYGLPVVATSVGGIPEAVRDGEEGLLVPPGDVPALADALRRVLDDAAFARRLAQAGHERALAEYGPERIALALGAVYDDVLARGAPRRTPAAVCV